MSSRSDFQRSRSEMVEPRKKKVTAGKLGKRPRRNSVATPKPMIPRELMNILSSQKELPIFSNEDQDLMCQRNSDRPFTRRQRVLEMRSVPNKKSVATLPKNSPKMKKKKPAKTDATRAKSPIVLPQPPDQRIVRKAPSVLNSSHLNDLTDLARALNSLIAGVQRMALNDNEFSMEAQALKAATVNTTFHHSTFPENAKFTSCTGVLRGVTFCRVAENTGIIHLMAYKSRKFVSTGNTPIVSFKNVQVESLSDESFILEPVSNNRDNESVCEL